MDLGPQRICRVSPPQDHELTIHHDFVNVYISGHDADLILDLSFCFDIDCTI